MVKSNRKNAYQEAYTILQELNEEEYSKIPLEVIQALKENRNEEYGTVKTLLPEAGALERATTYRDKKIKPLFTQVKNKIAAMAAQVKELAEEVEKWKHKYQKTKQAYNQIQRELDAVREEKEQLFDEKQQLQDVSDRYDRVVRGWTWYTGTAGWYYYVGIQEILGLKKLGDTLVFNPNIPIAWDSFKLDYTYMDTIYHVEVIKSKKEVVTLDGKKCTVGIIPLVNDKKEHKVVVHFIAG